MGQNSAIEWTHHTFNPWQGCQKVGPGCDNCYAEARDIRFTGGSMWGPHAARKRTSAATWRKPLAWNHAAAAAGERHQVFCASLADVFDNHHSIEPAWRLSLWALIRETPHLDWMLLTKRPGNIARMLPPDWDEGWPNVWLGCTVVNRDEMLRDGPKLVQVPAAIRFWSVEPLLADVGEVPRELMPDLVIVGGESGPGARPMHPVWARSLRDQCSAAGVAFHFKQWGEWAPHPHEFCLHPDTERLERVGKKRAGRLLDGRTWDEMPEIRHV